MHQKLRLAPAVVSGTTKSREAASKMYHVPNDDSDIEDEPTVPLPPAARAIPGSIIRIARPGTPAAPPTTNGAIPGSIIRVARPTPSQTAPAPPPQRPKHPWRDHPPKRLQRRSGLGGSPRSASRIASRGVWNLHVWRTIPLNVNLHLEDRFHAPVASSGWQAVREDPPERKAYSLDEVLSMDTRMHLVDWQGKPTPVVDADRNILFCLGSFPNDERWGPDVADAAKQAMQRAAIDLYSDEGWLREGQPAARRGVHHAESVSPSMGGGQPYPQNLAHSVHLLAIFTGLFALKPFERIAGWTNMLFMAFAPVLHAFYETPLEDLCTWDHRQERNKHIRRNFPPRCSVFSTTTFNFGPRTVTFPHIDFWNLAWGWCAITALGDFDPDCGGHLRYRYGELATTRNERTVSNGDQAWLQSSALPM
ncbi:hypothetical protein MSAN_02331800 [Mycena sanguinolenta]|uniref:Uncharacterized protein n=1 Tax=Mycena sanguinolenta TaxID=230812 RepID=A0A8H6X789_9AGAR|nr:hypothetical protein MSAN_02331800 [Mycena sanguinolenta]